MGQGNVTQDPAMLDTIGADAGHVPRADRKVAVYVTGSGGVEWPQSEIDALIANHDQIAYIDQAPAVLLLRQYRRLVIDVEPGCKTNQQALAEVQARQRLGLITDLYTPEANLDALVNTIVDAGARDGVGGIWMANWNLSHREAVGQLGQRVRGIPIVAIQWASPTSNPTEPVPASSQDLAQANIDLSVTVAGWPVPEPPRPSKRKRHRVTLHKPKQVHAHPKTKAAASGGAGGVGLAAVLASFGVHLTPAEWTAIASALATLTTWLTPAP